MRRPGDNPGAAHAEPECVRARRELTITSGGKAESGQVSTASPSSSMEHSTCSELKSIYQQTRHGFKNNAAETDRVEVKNDLRRPQHEDERREGAREPAAVLEVARLDVSAERF